MASILFFIFDYIGCQLVEIQFDVKRSRSNLDSLDGVSDRFRCVTENMLMIVVVPVNVTSYMTLALYSADHST